MPMKAHIFRQHRISAVPHETIRWALQGWVIGEHYLPLRSKNHSIFVRGITESILLFMVIDMLKQIELTLKERLERFLKRTYGITWWSALPKSAQRNAENRQRWASGQLGARRILSRFNIAWLSMGDLLHGLSSLNPVEWQVCLDAENHRIRKFESALKHVKAFRDYHLAHPKPREVSNKELRTLCGAVRSLPAIIRPIEWDKTLQLLHKVKALSPNDRSELSFIAHSLSSRKRTELREWVVCPDLENPVRCTHNRHYKALENRWREYILRWCADLDAGGDVFFGR